MRKVTITNRAFAMVEAYRDEQHTDQVKANLLDVVCSVIDNAETDQAMSRENLRLLSAISDLNDLITELSKTNDH